MLDKIILFWEIFFYILIYLTQFEFMDLFSVIWLVA